MKTTQQDMNQKIISLYRKYWFKTLTVIWFLAGIIFLISKYTYINGYVLKGSILDYDVIFFITKIAFFIGIWLFFAGIKTRKPSFLFANNQRIVRFLLIPLVVVFLLFGFPWIVHAPLIGIAMLIHFIFTIIFLWFLPVSKELWGTTNKTFFLVKFIILLISGVALWRFAFHIISGFA